MEVIRESLDSLYQYRQMISILCKAEMNNTTHSCMDCLCFGTLKCSKRMKWMYIIHVGIKLMIALHRYTCKYTKYCLNKLSSTITYLVSLFDLVCSRRMLSIERKKNKKDLEN